MGWALNTKNLCEKEVNFGFAGWDSWAKKSFSIS